LVRQGNSTHFSQMEHEDKCPQLFHAAASDENCRGCALADKDKKHDSPTKGKLLNCLGRVVAWSA
jgi:hypothetical protein